MGAIQEAGEHLFAQFQKVLPAPDAKAGKRAAKPKAIEQGLAGFYAEARAERLRRGLGVVGRARVLLHLQQRLAGAGYPPALIRQVLFSLLMSAFVGGKGG